jgi:hypothetical protein
LLAVSSVSVYFYEDGWAALLGKKIATSDTGPMVDWQWHMMLTVKGFDRPFELRGESRLIRSVITNWMLSKFFISFKRVFITRSAKNLGMPLNNF